MTSGNRDAVAAGRAGELPKAGRVRDVMARRALDLLEDLRVIDALGGAELDDQDMVGLRILLDLDNAPGTKPGLDDILAEFADRDGGDPDWDYEVAGWLERMYSRTEGAGAFGFEFIRETSGSGPNGYNVYRFLPDGSGQFIATSGEASELSNEDGFLGAVRTAGHLASKHDELKATTDRLFPERGRLP